MKYAFLVALSVLSISGNTTKQIYNSGNLYSTVAKVIDVDRVTDTVTCIDGIGEVYKFYSVDDWMPGDYCSMVVFDNNTDSIHDDIIVNCHYEIIP